MRQSSDATIKLCPDAALYLLDSSINFEDGPPTKRTRTESGGLSESVGEGESQEMGGAMIGGVMMDGDMLGDGVGEVEDFGGNFGTQQE